MFKAIKYCHFDPIVIAFIIILCAGYCYLGSKKNIVEKGYFLVAILLILLSACSPLYWLGMHYLFSAHMISHVLLFLVVPPLLVLAIPSHLTRSQKHGVRVISRIVGAVPWLAWLLGIGIMWFWHIPYFFDHAMKAHGGQTVSLIIFGLIFWWPVFGPLRPYRLPSLKGVLYLFTACVSCSLLGLLITFSPLGMYTHYLHLPDVAFSVYIRHTLGITAELDQQAAGLIMWVPGCLIYLSGAIFLLREWFLEKDEAIGRSNDTLILKSEIL